LTLNGQWIYKNVCAIIIFIFDITRKQHVNPFNE
jgi:hypothetical protein